MKKLIIIGVIALITSSNVSANNSRAIADKMEQIANSCLAFERQLKDSPDRHRNQEIHRRYGSCMSCRQTCSNLANTVRNVNQEIYSKSQYQKCENAMYQCNY